MRRAIKAMNVLARPGGNGQSRSKWTAAAFAVWAIGGEAVGIPADIITKGGLALGALFGIFLRDAR